MLAAVCVLAAAERVHAWDYEVHRIVNQLALAALPADFPSFVHEAPAAERIAFLSGEPDRWRNTPDLALRHVNHPDHYMDIEELEHYGLKDEDLPRFRYLFIARLAEVRKERPESLPPIDPERNRDHTKQWVGTLPWAMTEHYSRLKSGFSYLRALEQHGGTPEEIENARQNIIYVMGVMGHFAGDAAQPLHTTMHFNGWVGDNPHGYTTNRSFHADMDGGFFARAGLPDLEALKPRVGTATGFARPGRIPGDEDVFRQVVRFIRAQQQLVEPLYRLEKEGAFAVGGDPAPGREFLEEQVVRGGRLLAELWTAAWQDAPEDSWLTRRLRETRPPADAGN